MSTSPRRLSAILATALISLATLAGVAAADPGARRAHPDRAALKARFDLDKDGALSPAERAQAKQAMKAERAARRAQMIAPFDADKDGALSPAERDAMRAARAQAAFTALDTNRDGVLSLAEFKAGKAGKGHHARAGHRGGMRGMGR